MARVRFKRKIPIYALMIGTSSNVGTSNVAMVPFANTFVSSNGIIRDSSTRVRVEKKGFYELLLPLDIRATHGSGFIGMTVQTGINGAWTTQTSIASLNSANSFPGYYAFILELQANDYLEVRTVTSTTPTSHIVYCNAGVGVVASAAWVTPILSMKRL